MRRVPVLLVLILCGCEASMETPSAHFTVDTLPSGRVQVTNDGVGVWTSETRWALEEDLRLGTLDEEGPEQFARVGDILADEEGRIYILDGQSQDIRVFLSDGEYSHTIGNKGQGPGELERAAGLNWGPDGDLWVWASQRYSAFTKSGEFVTSHPRLLRGVIYPWIGGFVSDGRYIDWGLAFERTGQIREGRPVSTGRVTFYPISFTAPDLLDTLSVIEFFVDVTAEGQMKVGRKSAIVAQADDGNVWFALSDEYTLHKRTLDGDTLLTFGVPSNPMPIPTAEIDSLVRYWNDQPSPTTYSRELWVPTRRLVTRVLTDNAGYVFVMPQEDGLAAGLAIDVFEESGVYLGRMELGEAVLQNPSPLVTPTHIYGVVLDEFDVSYVVRWRIVRP